MAGCELVCEAVQKCSVDSLRAESKPGDPWHSEKWNFCTGNCILAMLDGARAK
jgi:hypothetical protein